MGLSERFQSQVIPRIQQCVQCRFRQTQHGADLSKGHTVGGFCLLIVSKTGQILLHDGFCGLVFHQGCNGALAVQLTVGQNFRVLPAADALVPGRQCTVVCIFPTEPKQAAISIFRSLFFAIASYLSA